MSGLFAVGGMFSCGGESERGNDRTRWGADRWLKHVILDIVVCNERLFVKPLRVHTLYLPAGVLNCICLSFPFAFYVPCGDVPKKQNKFDSIHFFVKQTLGFPVFSLDYQLFVVHSGYAG